MAGMCFLASCSVKDGAGRISDFDNDDRRDFLGCDLGGGDVVDHMISPRVRAASAYKRFETDLFTNSDLEQMGNHIRGRDTAVAESDPAFAIHKRSIARAWDQAVILLARQIEDGQTVRAVTRPYFDYWLDDYVALIHHIESLGYKFGYLDELPLDTETPTAYLRYDVHSRDLAPAIGILDANYGLGVPSVSFISWELMEIEDGCSRDFLGLKRFGDITNFGLHASPLPRVVADRYGQHDEWANWLEGPEFKAYLDAFVGNDADDVLAKERELAVKKLIDTWADFENNFPGASTVAYHGSGFDRVIGARCKQDSKYCAAKDVLTVKPLLQNSESELPDGVRIVDFDRSKFDFGYTSDTIDPALTLESLDAFAEEKKSFTILIHPAQLARGKRPWKDLIACHKSGCNPSDVSVPNPDADDEDYDDPSVDE